MQATIQMKITDEKSLENLEKICRAIGSVRCQLVCDILAKKNANELKKHYIRHHGLTARQYNSLSCEVKGLVKSAEELRKVDIRETKSRKQSQKKSIANLKKKLQELVKDKKKEVIQKRREKKSLHQRIHEKKRKLYRTQLRLDKLQQKRVSICLGGKKLFKAQFNLKENGYKDHQEWLTAWRNKRCNRIFYIGSKDEKFGNQNCQLIGDYLQVRVLPCLEQELGKYIQIPVNFTYQQGLIQHALEKSQAINYRFVRKDKGWYLYLTTKRPAVKKVTRRAFGAIGVDINKAHLAFSEVNHHGNLIHYGKIATNIQDRNSDQVSATFGDAIKQIILYAKQQQKPIVIENLDFAHKKTQFSLYSKRYRRMLSHFAYAKFQSMVESRAFREGVEVIKVNPAFTSIIGKYKFASTYGISIHIAAALVLARRGLRFSEFLPTRTAQILAVHRSWHVWKKWRTLVKAVSNRKKRVGLDPRLMPSRKPLKSFCEMHLSSHS